MRVVDIAYLLLLNISAQRYASPIMNNFLKNEIVQILFYRANLTKMLRTVNLKRRGGWE